MKIIEVNSDAVFKLAGLVAEFRVELNSLKGIESNPDIAAGAEEIAEYFGAGFPVYAAIEQDKAIGYMVCRVDAPCVWVESIFVAPDYRRKGVASLLIAEAQSLAASYGEDTPYFFVHPNNHGMLLLLRKHGYSVLNLLEVRRPYKGERLTQKIEIGAHSFDY